jgi:GMP synthase-like glutamine amidotransferase
VYQCGPELGFRDVFASSAASTDPLLGGAPERFSMFHAHTYAFEPPAQAEVLLSNEVCVQACRYGNSWAFQCHPEVTRGWVEELAAGLRGCNGSLKPETADFFGRNGVSAEQLERDGRTAEPVLRKLAAGIGTGFAAVSARQRST